MLGTDTTSPYSYAWTSVAAGSYSLTAKATDNLGAVTTSAAVGITVNAAGGGPVVGTWYNLTNRNSGKYMDVTGSSTADGAQLDQWTANSNTSQQWTLTATDSGYYTLSNRNSGKAAFVSDIGGEGAWVTQQPYGGSTAAQWTLTATDSGYYEITNRASGKAMQIDGGSTADGAIVVQRTYVSGLEQQWGFQIPPGSNNPPTVSITSPANGATFTAPASVTINATAADSDGTVSKVDFYQGATLLGTDTTSPYSYAWTSVAAGSYSLTAKATDNLGAVTTSTAVGITVNPAASAPTYQAAGSAVSGTGAITPVWPTHQSGDVALLVVESANQAISLSTPAGFVEVTNSPQGTGTAGGTAATRLAVYWKRATTSAESSPTVADSGNHQIARIITFRGAIASGNPWDVTAGNVASSASTSVSIPGATTTAANRLVVAIVANGTDTTSTRTSGWTNANLTSLTERIDNNTSSGNGGGFGVATGVKATAGAYGTTTATLATSSVQGRMSIALK